MYGEGFIGGSGKAEERQGALRGAIRRPPTTIGSSHRRVDPRAKRQRLEESLGDLLVRANIQNFWFHDLCHTFASWYMMNGGDLCELVSSSMTGGSAKLTGKYIIKTGDTVQGHLEHVE